jgi:hypothetical protein
MSFMGDVLITGVGREDDAEYFSRSFNNRDLYKLDGLRFRNCYLTTKAIETGGPDLFLVLYRAARVNRGTVSHVSAYYDKLAEDAVLSGQGAI